MLPPARHRRGYVAAVGVSALSVLAAAALGAAPATAVPSDGSSGHRGAANLPKGLTSAGSYRLGTQRTSAEKVDRSLAGAKGQVDVMIELEEAPASSAFTTARSRGPVASKTAGRAQTAVVKRAQATVESHFGEGATRARTLYRAHALYSGVAVRTDASRVQALAALPGVKAVHRITPKRVSNSSSVPLIGAPEVWKGRGETGQGVRVGVIDTGIDYTHADFGGPGTKAAFEAASASNTFHPTAKVVGGYDFAGDAYNPSEGNAVPVPDANPIDCEGHGSHVSGTAAGLGVNAGGTTYTGGYSSDIDPASLSIGPGVAPGASLYALKVFGCEGDTSILGQALDWAADPNGDGDLSDRLDVVNMSLGSSYGSPDDPDAVASNNLAALGTVVVASIGNSGDVYDVGGSPGNATRVLAVAASDDGNDVVDGLKVDSPAGIEPANTVDAKQDNVFAALRSAAYDWENGPGLTNTEVVTLGDWSVDASTANNTDGCSAFSTADAAKVAGKIVMTKWFDGVGRRCGSVGRSGNARAAGAAGVIFGSDVNSFSAGVTGDTVIPAMLTVNQATLAIKSKLDAGTPVRVTMTNALRNSGTIVNHRAVDQVAGFSSRGVGIAGNVKPDVAAPGVTTFSAAVGSGNEGVAESGTSMAAPHVAGEAALVRGVHSTWSVEEVKAAIMNTATQDVYVGPNHTGDVYGPERVGSGRVKVAQAVGTSTLAYVKDTPGAVSVSFGPVAVTAATTTLTKTVRVVNKRPTGTSAYTIGYQAAHPTPGVTYSFSPNQVSLPAGGSVDVKVTATITRSALRAVQDPTTESDPLGIGIRRSYRADASGRMVLTPTPTTPGSALRVPVWSAPRPASVMKAAASSTVTGAGAVKTGTLALGGTGVSQGTGSTGYESMVSTFELQGTSPRIPSCSSTLIARCIAIGDDRSADLRYVGAASDAPISPSLDDATLTFGISSYGRWRTPASYTEFDVVLDTNGDGTEDALVYNTRVVTTDDYDYFLSELVDLRDPANPAVLDDQLVNGADGSLDTNLFNSDSLVLPVSVGVLKAAGLVAGTSPKVKYWVESYTGEAGRVDTQGSAAAPMTISLASPALSAYGDFGTLLSTDLPGELLDVRRDDASYASDKPQGLLLVHHLNTDGQRAQVVGVKAPSSTRLTSSATSYTYGGRPVLTATVTPANATGTVSFKDNGTVVRTVAVSGGKAVWTVTGQTRGTHTMTATYNGDASTLTSTSPGVRVTVAGLASKSTLAVNDRDYGYGYRPTLTATVTPSGATGTATFRDGARVLGTVPLSSGKAVYRAPVLARGTHYLTATYNGSSKYNPAGSAKVSVVVR
ncbi:S8 family serine peptidase [Pedococcus sp. 5OH_020]|uniref:S8 family serine peptidase n=1 Tax=Pedococcus sp. 5OH_020 TaxID=2989814 RepID=UPI0022E9F739|nr:S8 family serine peptidase [Pedococcus sp. 5OH_020]